MRVISKATVALARREATCLSQMLRLSLQATGGHRKCLPLVHWQKSYVGNSHSRGDHRPNQVPILLHLPYQPFQKRAMSPRAHSSQVLHHHPLHPLHHLHLCQAWALLVLHHPHPRHRRREVYAFPECQAALRLRLHLHHLLVVSQYSLLVYLHRPRRHHEAASLRHLHTPVRHACLHSLVATWSTFVKTLRLLRIRR